MLIYDCGSNTVYPLGYRVLPGGIKEGSSLCPLFFHHKNEIPVFIGIIKLHKRCLFFLKQVNGIFKIFYEILNVFFILFFKFLITISTIIPFIAPEIVPASIIIGEIRIIGSMRCIMRR